MADDRGIGDGAVGAIEGDFHPRALGNHEFKPSEECLEQVSHAERELVRFDERMRFHPYREVVSDHLTRLDILSSGRLICSDMSLYGLFVDAFAANAGTRGREVSESLQKICGNKGAPPSWVRGYGAGLKWLQEHRGMLTVDDMARMYRGFGETAVRKAGHDAVMQSVEKESGRLGVLRERTLVEELLRYCGRPHSTPLVQTAVAHFRFEAICPFDEYMDCMGRLLSHSLLMRRSLETQCIVPIGMHAALDIEQHNRVLAPYRFSAHQTTIGVNDALDTFARGCAASTLYAVRVGLDIVAHIQEIAQRWEKALGGVRSDSALRASIHVILGAPVFDREYLVSSTGRSTTAVNEAIRQLVRCGIIRQINEGRRNQFFEAPDVTDLFSWIEGRAFGSG